MLTLLDVALAGQCVSDPAPLLQHVLGIFPSCFYGFHGCRTFVHPHATSRPPRVEPPQTCVDPDQSLSRSVSLPLSHLVFALLQDGKEGFEKWRVENSWGDDRGNKGRAVKIPSFHLFSFNPPMGLCSETDMRKRSAGQETAARAGRTFQEWI